MKLENNDLKETDKSLVTTYYQLLEKVRLNNKTLTKKKATELAVIMLAKIYARSVLIQMEKLERSATSMVN